MNGREAMKIAEAALRFAAADDRRKRTRAEFRIALKTAGTAGLVEYDSAEGRVIVGPEELVEAQAAFRSAACSVAGYRRGLARACESALRSGVKVPGLALARNGRA